MPCTWILLSHTHWDREWYEPFQVYRLWLVRMMDTLLDLLESDARFVHFTLDGQTIILRDYLEIRPEQEAALQRLIRQGRLLIGPWYTLPDFNLVSGESIIRNLLLGDRICHDFGAKMNVGYIPDPFGQISQMPQILRGFGIDTAIFRRGLDDHPLELVWESPDGSAVLVSYLRDGYDNAANLPVRSAEEFLHAIRRAAKSLAPYSATGVLLLMNGSDHLWPQPEIPNRLVEVRRSLGEAELIHGTLPQYIEMVKERLGWSEGEKDLHSLALPRISGELRSPKRHHLLPGVLSTRMWIKQRNAECQTLLEKWVEPTIAFARWVTGEDRGDASLAWQAWTYLLQNQAHDSVCGCGVDAAHADMVGRYDWVEQIGGRLVAENLVRLASAIDTMVLLTDDEQETGRPARALVVLNPLSHHRTDVVTTEVQVPGSLSRFVLRDAQGNAVPYQVLGVRDGDLMSLDLDADTLRGALAMVRGGQVMGLAVQEVRAIREGDQVKVDISLAANMEPDMAEVEAGIATIQALLSEEQVCLYHVQAHLATTVAFCFVAHDVPPHGYATYALVPGEPADKPVPADCSQSAIENEFYLLRAEPDGTFTLVDKNTLEEYPSLNRFVDGGDRGDEYNYCAPPSDTVVDAPVAPPIIEVLECGPVRWRIQMKMAYRLPARLAEGRERRSDEMVEIPIVTIATLYSGVPRVDFEARVTNCAEDHRLRVHFPTGLIAETSWAESTFDVVSRGLTLPAHTENWMEQPVPTHPQQNFVDVTDGLQGFALLNRGLPEYEAIRNPDGTVTLTLTLLRCVGWLSRDDMACRVGHAGPALETPGAQCLGEHVFHYAVALHPGDWSAVLPQAHAFNAPLRAIGSDIHDGDLPPSLPLVEVTPESVIVTAIKLPEQGDGLIVRLHNAAAQPMEATLRLWRVPRAAAMVSLSEEHVADLTVGWRGDIHVPLCPRGLATVRVRF